MEDNTKMLKFQEELLKKVSQNYDINFDELKKKCAFSKKDLGNLNKSKSKSKKDKSHLPKRPTTAYFYYMNENRAAMKEKHPDDKATNLAKKIAEVWNKMSDKDKKPYLEKAEKDKLRYQTEMAEITKDQPVKPKKAKTAYFCFMDEVRNEYKTQFPNEKMTILSKKMGEAWRNLNDTDKQKYVDIAEKQKKELSK